MNRRLLAMSGAIGLILAIAPAAFADNPVGTTTGVTVYVNTGTTIYAPAAFAVNSSPGNIPGETVTSGSNTVQWMSNDTGKSIKTYLAGDLTSGTGSITTGDVTLVMGSAVGTLNTHQPLSSISLTGHGRGSANFQISVFIPSVPAGTYTGTLTFLAE